MNQCFLCGTTTNLERHHIFGAANRQKSEEDGLVVYLCHNCHNEPPYGVHHNEEMMDELHRYGQRAWMERNKAGIAAFRRRYGKNYL